MADTFVFFFPAHDKSGFTCSTEVSDIIMPEWHRRPTYFPFLQKPFLSKSDQVIRWLVKLKFSNFQHACHMVTILWCIWCHMVHFIWSPYYYGPLYLWMKLVNSDIWLLGKKYQVSQRFFFYDKVDVFCDNVDVDVFSCPEQLNR